MSSDDYDRRGDDDASEAKMAPRYLRGSRTLTHRFLARPAGPCRACGITPDAPDFDPSIHDPLGRGIRSSCWDCNPKD